MPIPGDLARLTPARSPIRAILVLSDPQNDDYHITENSPVIDKGIDTWTSIDMDGQARPSGESDLGADEYGQFIPVYLPMLSR